MKINGLQKLTLLDFPGKTACIVFTPGCNFRCPFCHNASLVTHIDTSSQIEENEFFSFLEKRRRMLDGVCITGGEPLMQNGIKEFIKRIKDMGYAVKLDTNGTYPDKLEELIKDGLLDYVAMDIKNCKEKYALTSGISDIVYEDIIKSINIISNSNVDHEFRTTVTNELHTPEDIGKIAETIKGEKKYFLQNFTDSGDVISCEISSVSQQKLDVMLSFAKEHIPNTQIR